MIRKKKNKTKKMTAITFFKKTGSVQVRQIAGKKMAVLPLDIWEDIDDYFEDLAISQSRYLAAKIKKARAEKKSYTLEEVKRRLGL